MSSDDKGKTLWADCEKKGQDLTPCFEKNKDLIEGLGSKQEVPAGKPTQPLVPTIEQAELESTEKPDFGLVIIQGSYGTAGEGMDSFFEELTTPWVNETQPLRPIIEGALAADADDDE